MKQTSAFAKKLARMLDDKKAERIKILDVRKLSSVTEYFVFASASSSVHARSLAEYIRDRARADWKIHHLEGLEGGDWILIDFVEVIVHIFLPETREFYGLEQLWGDAKNVEISKNRKT
jgi:ribosome-associated protein